MRGGEDHGMHSTTLLMKHVNMQDEAMSENNGGQGKARQVGGPSPFQPTSSLGLGLDMTLNSTIRRLWSLPHLNNITW